MKISNSAPAKKVKSLIRKSLRNFSWLVVAVFKFSGTILRRLYPEWDARNWSNIELKRWGKLLPGSVINVSGWKDGDRANGFYRDYFVQCTQYAVSNIKGARGHEADSGLREKGIQEIFLDLTKPLPNELKQQFDVAFNHTTLEHIFDIEVAFKQLCDLSKDIVIIVVPFLQSVHFIEGSFSDFWRPTPFAMEALFKKNGFEILYQSNNDNPVNNVYLFCVATRNADKWRSNKEIAQFNSMTNIPGYSRYHFSLPSSQKTNS